MNKEEIEELKDFTIDLTDIDELALGLEVCSKKSNMVIQEFADTIIQLQKEIKILRENAEHNDKVVDKVNWENMLLKKENQELKKQLEENKDKINWYENFEINKTIDKLRIKHNNQQKEFIEYLENEIYSIEPKGTGINYNCEYDSEEDYINAMEEQSKLNTFKEILSKYREIIGSDINVGSIGDKDE